MVDELLIGKAAQFADADMGVKLIGRFEMRAGDENGDFAHRLRQRGIVGERLDQLPARLAERRLVQPRIPRPDQRAILAHRDEAFETFGDALAHVVVERRAARA